MTFPYLVYFPFGLLGEDELRRRSSAVIAPGSARNLGKSESRRSAYFAGRAALAVALERVGFAGAKVAADPNYGYLQVIGKEREVFVNVSHSGDFAVAAVCSHPIGVDVEKSDRSVGRVLGRVATESELKQISSQVEVLGDGGTVPAPVALWCGKEACSKAVGLGIKFGMQAFEVGLTDCQPSSATIRLCGPLVLTSPAIRYAWVEGHVVAVCAERRLLEQPWACETLR